MIKPFLGIDITNDKKNEKYNGDEFTTATVSPELADELESLTVDAIDIIDKSEMPLPFNIVKWVTTIGAVAVVGGILKSDVSLAEGYSNAPALYWIGGACALIAIVMNLIAKIVKGKHINSNETKTIETDIESLSAKIKKDFGIPDGASEVDILQFCYKVKDGEIAVKGRGVEFTPYHTLVFDVYTDDSRIHFANLEGRYSIPLSSLTRITKVAKKISIDSWNKETEPAEGEYKQYKLTVDKYDCVHMKEYYILEFDYYGETLGIYFPCYELPLFENLTGLKADN